MNLNKVHNIEGSEHLLTKTDLENYYSGRLSGNEMNRIEQQLENSDFEKEAWEGFANSGGIVAMDGILESVQHKTGFSSSSGGVGAGFFAQIITIAAVFLGFFFVLDSPEENNTIVMNSPVNKSGSDKNKTLAPNTQLAYLVTEEPLGAESEELELIEDEGLAKLAAYRKSIGKSLASAKEIEPEEIVEESDIEPELGEESAISNANNSRPKANRKTLLLQNLKTVDYSDEYTSDLKHKTTVLNSLSPEYSNKEESKTKAPTIEQQEKYIPYKKFLESTLEKYQKKKYRKALKDFKIILKQFPNDVNAQFYSGLSYYNMGKPKDAINYFDKVINSKVNVFDEEAIWYKALSLSNSKQTELANIILKRIVSEQGFYSERAKEKLAGK